VLLAGFGMALYVHVYSARFGVCRGQVMVASDAACDWEVHVLCTRRGAFLCPCLSQVTCA
jgi:hypothetical protein